MLIADIPQSFSGPADWKEKIDKKKKDFVGSGKAISFLLMDKTGETHTFSHQPCHGALSGRRGFVVATSVCGRANISAKNKTAKAFFLDWWCNRSYASRFILNRDTYVEDDYVAVTGDLWFPFMNCLNIVNRSIYEKPEQHQDFYRLVQKGVPEDVAFVVCFSTTYSFLTAPTQKAYFQGSHCPISGLSVEGLKNFFLRDAQGYKADKTGWFSTDNGNYYGGVLAFQRTNPPRFWMKEFYDDKTFRQALAVARKEEAVAFKNPFQRTNTMSVPDSYTKDEFDAVVIPFMTEIYHQCHKESCQ